MRRNIPSNILHGVSVVVSLILGLSFEASLSHVIILHEYNVSVDVYVSRTPRGFKMRLGERKSEC